MIEIVPCQEENLRENRDITGKTEMVRVVLQVGTGENLRTGLAVDLRVDVKVDPLVEDVRIEIRPPEGEKEGARIPHEME